MSDMRIRSGAGNGKVVHVTDDNLLKAAVRTETQQDHEVELGNSYNFNPGVISLTGTTATGILYIKNTGDNPIVIPAAIWMPAVTDGSGYWTLKVITGTNLSGTLKSGGTAFTPVNRLVGSPNTLTATCLYGAYGDTVSGGDTALETIVASVGRVSVPVKLELPKGAELAMEITAPAGTTAATVMAAIAPFERTVDL